MKRNKQRRKRQAVILVSVVIIAVVIVAGIGIWRQRTKVYSAGEGSAQVSVEDREQDKYVYNDHLSNYLFMGIDTRGNMEEAETQNAGQADSVFLVSMDRVTHQIQVISIPRDTMTEIEAFSVLGKSLGMMESHINLQYAQGDGKTGSCELMKTAVSNLLGGIPIQGYCSINMDAIPVMTELAGNVEVTVPDDSLSEVNPEFTEGAVVTLTKENAEQFVRHRDTSKEQSALVRQSRQKVFLEAYMKKAQEQYAKDPSFVTKLYEGVKSYMVTNIGNDVFVKLLSASQEQQPVVHTLPGEGAQGAHFDEYHVDEEALQELLQSVFYKDGN